MHVVDANVVLRYLLNDHEELSAKARQIIEGRVVRVPIDILCEVVFVLSGVYKIKPKEIGIALHGFFESTACELPNREVVLRGLDLFAENNLDFVDCILAGYKNVMAAEVHTFDKG
jgi:predicted nucleic-acid-binding protein